MSINRPVDSPQVPTPPSPEIGPTDTGDDADNQPRVEITIVHGSLGGAEYALMIGGFADEQLGGQERFIDRQFAGLLTSWEEVGLFPTKVGASRFIDLNPDVETEPPGCYVIGLGSVVDLQREQLTFSVRQALVDRCIRLYREPLSSDVGAGGGLIEVGVSSSLMGVRSDRGLRVEDSVAGIVEGVLQANQALALYESSRAEEGRVVRITALEFVERFAEQANLAAVALRSLSTAVHLPTSYDSLRKVTVDERPGGLPLGATLTDVAQGWRRFVITAADTSDASGSGEHGVADADDRCVTFDIALLGREARADRVRHRLDKTMVDALVDHLAVDTSDQRSAGTLYDQLIPHELRSDFQTTSAIQFVVDATTAKYPWELLGAPRPNGRRSAGGSFGGVIRQFTESESRRLSPVRAEFGSSLVIAAGKVPGERELPAVYDECALVSQLLASTGGQVTQLDDRRSELDLVDLQNELFGRHQVMHIASHGVYHEDHPADTGAILARGAMLTTDTIRQLTTVPDVVFLNCCSLGRIGLNRMAAGLAREFMAIGVRALIAAAWPIDDKAAQVFAETFYRELIAGRPLGDTVTRARNTCAEVGGRETWAAYQCYGDPGFVLRGSRLSLGEAVAEPVSESDLIARLDGLAVRVSDLGRPGRGGVVDRRNRLLEIWNQLAGWIDGRRELAMDSPIQRRLATTARDLGEYRVAAARFRRFVVGDGSPPVVGPQVEEASVADVQQAANCLARAGQWAARQAATDASSERMDMAIGELSLAAELARAAATLLSNRESHGVLASALKRWATVDAKRRTELLTEALDTYRKADETITDARFGAENALQLGFVLGGEYAEWATAQLSSGGDDDSASNGSSDTSVAGCRIDQRRIRAGDFWSRADAGDRALTKLMAADGEPARTAATDEMVHAYERAFASRSTWSERQSAIDHVGDLLDLIPADDARRAHLLHALDQLDKWEQAHVERVASPTNAALAATAPAGPPARTHDLASGVALTAFPAGCGDCLLVEWDGSTGHHRLLVDGGMPSALDDGLGRYAASQPAARLTVDVAVVTHIDLDHIGGMIDALRNGLVESPNVWFNGLDEIRSATRGPRQGDELSALIPAERRNVNVSGGAILVPDDGTLPVFELADGAVCTLLAPTLERLVALERAWGSGKRGDADDPIDDLLHRLGDDLERGSTKSFGSDHSVANGSSIAFLFEFGGTSLLLTGDAYGPDLQRTIGRLLDERKAPRLEVDLFKLAHHGSMNNVTSELLDLIDPGTILICTDGTRFGHPDRETIELLRKHYPTTPIQFTDDTPIIRERAALAGTVPPTSSPVSLRF